MSIQLLLEEVGRVDGVSKVRCVENMQQAAANGIPPFSVAFVVDGGDHREIAVAILMHLPETIETVGDVVVNVDYKGFVGDIRFSRPMQICIDANRVHMGLPIGGVNPRMLAMAANLMALRVAVLEKSEGVNEVRIDSLEADMGGCLMDHAATMGRLQAIEIAVRALRDICVPGEKVDTTAATEALFALVPEAK